jgi:HSP20 family molecular chaperone IbpA
MTYYIAPYPYRMAHRWPRMSDYEETTHDFTLAVDVRDEDDAYVISALVPGLKADR